MHEDHEFVTAYASRYVHSLEVIAYDIPDAGKDPVSGAVAVGVVNMLEFIGIQDHESADKRIILFVLLQGSPYQSLGRLLIHKACKTVVVSPQL